MYTDKEAGIAADKQRIDRAAEIIAGAVGGLTVRTYSLAAGDFVTYQTIFSKLDDRTKEQYRELIRQVASALNPPLGG